MSKKANNKILYLTYDGLTDHIGQSQILPYLIGCSKKGLEIHILSFEKQEKAKMVPGIQQQLESANIKWYPVRFSQGSNLSKIYDFLKFFFTAFRICIRHQYAIVHSRSYTASNIALLLKFFLRKKIIFDKRDFWIDAKIETGRLVLSKFSHRLIHSFLRFFERRLFLKADHIVSLTEKAKQIVLKKYPSRRPEDISVIPCCVDLSLFDPKKVNADAVRDLKTSLGLDGSCILGYVGSIGPAYMVPELLQCFQQIRNRISNAKLLLLVNNDKEEVYKIADALQVSRDGLVVTSAPRAQMPLYISAMDYGIYFITPSFAKQATSPTKLSEMLALQKAVITNNGVGDAEKIFDELQCGYLVSEFSSAGYEKAAEWLERQTNQPHRYDLSCYSLDYGIEQYSKIYYKLLAR